MTKHIDQNNDLLEPMNIDQDLIDAENDKKQDKRLITLQWAAVIWAVVTTLAMSIRQSSLYIADTFAIDIPSWVNLVMWAIVAANLSRNSFLSAKHKFLITATFLSAYVWQSNNAWQVREGVIEVDSNSTFETRQVLMNNRGNPWAPQPVSIVINDENETTILLEPEFYEVLIKRESGSGFLIFQAEREIRKINEARNAAQQQTQEQQ